MRIKIDAADQAFSTYVRLRDKKCQRCGRRGTTDRFGNPIIGLECSHFFGRGKESTRFDEENADSLCMACHRIWGSDDREAYRDFKIRQLGEVGFQNLKLRAGTYQKKDRKLAKIYWRQRLKEDYGYKL